MGIEHHTITPLHPRANGLVENFNRMINKVIRTSAIERKCWKQELFKFLRNYRATPHVTTGKCPADLLFQSRTYRVRLPELSTFQKDDKEIRERDAKKKSQAKQYADRKRYVKPSTVVEKKGTMVTASRDNPRHVITRNSSFFKRLKIEENSDKVDQIDNDDEITENNVVDLEQVGSDDENNREQQFEDEAPEEWLGGEQERIEQENEVQEQLLPRERQEEDVDRGQQIMVGRPQRQRRVPGWRDQYEMGENF